MLELARAFAKASGPGFLYRIIKRCTGDVDEVYVGSSLAQRQLGWKAKFDVDAMCRDAWRWQSMNPDGYAAA
ncbi:hypothetical protein GCM10027084_25500 [Pseudoxanthomonas sangjuensis]|uniref:hypothetical protein n=1 Tax=Pseudoxanthomonas sangjuensis TaxID=1503750 RepID=UPI001392031D|nr:hypothetical protein [Pseudoxanthomonas sangjuensis]KAF1714289.1 hypothetical protein CSC71_04435 [Pseudoxanthomonas sangjuensis]